MSNDKHGNFCAILAVVPNLSDTRIRTGKNSGHKRQTDLTSFEVIAVESIEFSCHVDLPTLIFWGSEIVASDTSRVREPTQYREEPLLLLAPTELNSAYKVFGQTSNLSPCTRKQIQLVLDLQGGEVSVEKC